MATANKRQEDNRTDEAKAAVPSQVPAVLQERGVDLSMYNVLRNVVFPAAKDDGAIAMAFDYCKARGLDILKKPVHIVPVWDSRANGGRGGMVETVWPSIYEVRTTAARTGAYAGKDAPAFGPDVTKTFGAEEYSVKNRNGNWEKKKGVPKSYTFPESCTVTIYKLISGVRVAFSGTVYWEEAAVFTKDGHPNAMWSKRVRGQLAKCAEAEALRAAFPEETGGMMTAEEMEGRSIRNAETVGQSTTKAVEPDRFAERMAEENGEPSPAATTITDADYEEVQPGDDNAPDPEGGDAGGGSDEVKPWDGKTLIINGKPQEISVKDAAGGARYLMGRLKNVKKKAEREAMLMDNLPLMHALDAAGATETTEELWNIVNKGEANGQ